MSVPLSSPTPHDRPLPPPLTSSESQDERRNQKSKQIVHKQQQRFHVASDRRRHGRSGAVIWGMKNRKAGARSCDRELSGFTVASSSSFHLHNGCGGMWGKATFLFGCLQRIFFFWWFSYKHSRPLRLGFWQPVETLYTPIQTSEGCSLRMNWSHGCN